MDDSQKSKENVESEDLDSLLDSALNDFDKPLPKVPTGNNLTNKAPDLNASAAEEESCNWTNEFKQFHDVMQTILDDPDMQKEFEQLKNSTAATSAPSTDEDLTASIAEALRGLATSAQSMPQPTQEDLAEFLDNLRLADGAKLENNDQVPDFMPLMHNVMQSLLSKELLYPALKDIVEKYPDWLADKHSTLDKQQFEKYTIQYELMKQVCTEFETNTDDTEEGKAKSFEKILGLLQKMQDCGNPPKELVGDVNPELPFDEHGNMKLPGMPEQCIVM